MIAENIYLKTLAKLRGTVDTMEQPWSVEHYERLLKNAKLDEEDLALVHAYLHAELDPELRIKRTEREAKEAQLSRLFDQKEEYLKGAEIYLNLALSPVNPSTKAVIIFVAAALVERILGACLGFRLGDLTNASMFVFVLFPLTLAVMSFFADSNDYAEKLHEIAATRFEEAVARLRDEINAVAVEIADLENVLLAVDGR